MKPSTVTTTKPASIGNWLTFTLPSLLGLLLFVTPVKVDGQFTIPVALLAGGLKAMLETQLTTIITAVVTFTGLMTVVIKVFQPRFISSRPFMVSLFDITPLWAIVRVAGTLFVLCSYFQVGPEHIW